MASPVRILVFDSGLGGLTVFSEIARLRPDALYTYVADDAFFPYGDHEQNPRSPRVVPLIGDLIKHYQPELVVIACNTASTLVLSHLRAAFKVPFVGTVPAIKPACAASVTKRVSVLAYAGDGQTRIHKKLIKDFAQDCDVTLVGSSELARIAEAALRGEPVDDDAISAEIAPCFVDGDGRRTDAVVLACTHYPLLLDHVQETRTVDGGLDRSGGGDRAPRHRSDRSHTCAARHPACRGHLHIQPRARTCSCRSLDAPRLHVECRLTAFADAALTAHRNLALTQPRAEPTLRLIVQPHLIPHGPISEMEMGFVQNGQRCSQPGDYARRSGAMVQVRARSRAHPLNCRSMPAAGSCCRSTGLPPSRAPLPNCNR